MNIDFAKKLKAPNTFLHPSSFVDPDGFLGTHKVIIIYYNICILRRIGLKSN